MVQSWQPLRPGPARGVAIYTYNPTSPGEPAEDAPWRLQVFIGDTVVVSQECGDSWYFGHVTSNPALQGVFPKAYIRLIGKDFEKEDERSAISANAPPLVAEITAALREWNEILKEKFLQQVNLKF